jgi:hypothetical protein
VSEHPDCTPYPEPIGTLVAQVTEDDLLWFEQHQKRSFRIRPLVEREFWPYRPYADEGKSVRVVVRNLLPGARMRLPVSVSAEPINTDAVARGLWEATTGVAP